MFKILAFLKPKNIKLLLAVLLILALIALFTSNFNVRYMLVNIIFFFNGLGLIKFFAFIFKWYLKLSQKKNEFFMKDWDENQVEILNKFRLYKINPEINSKVNPVIISCMRALFLIGIAIFLNYLAIYAAVVYVILSPINFKKLKRAKTSEVSK
ncbi:MAG: hypothetical protein FWE37_03870 [Spirochaetaceae bacterium]|nr:hypothetical protein [Spirochaetaceae bacterium]